MVRNVSSEPPGPSGQRISSFLEERIKAGDFPSAVYLVAECGRVVFADALGLAVREPEHRAATLDTIYDLASLTKPLVTGLVLASLLERGEIDLDWEVSKMMDEFDRADKRHITVGQLLTHTSGLPAWRPLYITTGGDRERLLNVIAEEELDCLPGTTVRYSDLGFIVLGKLIERIEGATLAEIAQGKIFGPLELKSTFFNPDVKIRSQIAACETGNRHEREKCRDMAGARSFTKWREHLIWGEVHDGNAYFMGGAAGHAGLFSNARETLRLVEQFIPARTELLSSETCILFRTNMTPGLGEARSFAWQLAGTVDSAAGPALSSDSFGHLGFTGTSCWIDARQERVFILLTNRTHAHDLPFVIINNVRRTFHTMATELLNPGTAG